jgi:hypothetical protein
MCKAGLGHGRFFLLKLPLSISINKRYDTIPQMIDVVHLLVSV